jgi:hypothetical protein
VRGTIRATSAIPWLPTTSELVGEEASLAEQVASMLHLERQVMILITGGDSGRMSGFMAELTHAVSHGDTVLRIKAAIEVEELFVLLAGQMHLPTQGLSPMQLATYVGERLREAAPQGNYVLLCEAAHQYASALLENIRQLSNYPINIVISARPKLLRRLWHPALFALKQRLNYRLDLNEWQFTRAFKWLLALALVGGTAYLAWRWQSEAGASKAAALPQAVQPAPPPPLPDPIMVAPKPAEPPPTDMPSPAPEAPPPAEQNPGLSLIMEPALKQAPKR